MNFYSTLNTSLKRARQPLPQNQCFLILLPPLFQRISQLPDQNQQNGTQKSMNDHPSPSGLTLRMHPSYFYNP